MGSSRAGVGLAGFAVAIGLTAQSRPAPAVIESLAAESVPPPEVPRAPGPAGGAGAARRSAAGDRRHTFEARVHVWPGIDIATKVRLRGIDAAELRARCPAELAQAEAACDALKAMLAEGAVTVSNVTPDKYGGRVVADAGTRAIANVSAELLGRVLARRYTGGHRGWCDGP